MNIIKGSLIIALGAFTAACGPSEEDIAKLQQEMERNLAEAQAEMEESTDNAFDALEEEVVVDADLFTSTDGHYSINFPGVASNSSEVVDTDLGPTTMDMTICESEDGSSAYMVSFNDYHEPAILDEDPQILLNGGRDGALSSLGIAYTDEQHRLTLGDYEGIYFTGNNGTYFVDYEIYLIGQRLYQIAILSDKGYPSDADRDAFFDSFKLNNIEEIAE